MTRSKLLTRTVAKTQRGFTIMEVLIVLAIIALIMGVLVGPSLFGASEEAKNKMAYQVEGNMMAAYERWALEHSASCPDNISELYKYMNRDNVKDPWGNEFIMVCGSQAPPQAKGFGIISKGKDGKQGTPDDVVSWEQPTKK